MSHQRAEPLGGAVEQREASGQGGVEDRPPLGRREQAVQVRSGDSPPPERRHLVLHQRDQWRDDQREAAGQQRRELVAQRLPRSRGQHRQDAPAGEQRPQHLELVDPKCRVTEPLGEELPRAPEPASECCHRVRKRAPVSSPEPKPRDTWLNFATTATPDPPNPRRNCCRTRRISRLWAVPIRVVACDTRGTRDAAHAPRSRPSVDPSGFLPCPWERALRPGAHPSRSRTCRTLRRCGTTRRAAGLPARRARRGSDPIPYRPCAYSSSSGVPSRTSTRIAACGTTRYFVPSNVISTAALRKNSA